MNNYCIDILFDYCELNMLLDILKKYTNRTVFQQKEIINQFVTRSKMD